LSRRLFGQVGLQPTSSERTHVRDELFDDNEEIDEIFARSDNQRQDVPLVHEGEILEQGRNTGPNIGEALEPTPLIA
jgi:predicted MPP superfamily phosphohydrolase